MCFDWLIDWLTYWLIDWLVGWFINTLMLWIGQLEEHSACKIPAAAIIRGSPAVIWTNCGNISSLNENQKYLWLHNIEVMYLIHSSVQELKRCECIWCVIVQLPLQFSCVVDLEWNTERTAASAWLGDEQWTTETNSSSQDGWDVRHAATSTECRLARYQHSERVCFLFIMSASY